MYRGPCIDAQNDSFRVHTLRKHVQHAKLAALTTPGSQSPTPDDQKSDPGQVESELAPKGSARSVGVSPGWAFARLQRKTQHLLIGFRKWALSVVQKSCFFTRLQEGLYKGTKRTAAEGPDPWLEGLSFPHRNEFLARLLRAAVVAACGRFAESTSRSRAPHGPVRPYSREG